MRCLREGVRGGRSMAAGGRCATRRSSSVLRLLRPDYQLLGVGGCVEPTASGVGELPLHGVDQLTGGNQPSLVERGLVQGKESIG